MIPKNVREGAVAGNLPGEKQAFTIKANGKAFRTLIDGLYSNKILAVIRELCSNAADSHVDAGNTSPFLVQIPTNLDPTFRVRDYGTGLSHEDTMVLYTTIFESTKEETNEQTGQLGLGSKSPFAYTDSFQVTVWDGAECRQYMTLLETDGVPSIVHVGSFPSTEPRGLEVQFAAKREDIRQFQKEMQFVSLGYDHEMKPKVEGMDLKMPAPRVKGDGWAIYPRGAFGNDLHQANFIRQGSAVYPNDTVPFPNLGYGWVSVVTVPIGTANVTASRDALAYDNDTRNAIQRVLRSAQDSLKLQVEQAIDAAKTRIEKAKVFHEYNGILTNVRGSTIVSLSADGGQKYDKQGNLIDQPGDTLESAKYWGKSQQLRGYHSDRWVNGVDFQEIANFRLLVNDSETKVVRRMKRIRTAANYARKVYVLDIDDVKVRAEALAHIVKCLELKPDQIMLVSALPDQPPAKTVRKPSTKRVLAPGQFWMSRNKGRVTSEIFGESESRGIDEWPKAMVQAAKKAGVKLHWDDIFWVTEAQEVVFAKKGQLSVARKLDNHIQAELVKQANLLPIDEALTILALNTVVGAYNRALPVVKASFFPSLSITDTKAEEILAVAKLANIDLQSRPIVAKVNAEIEALIEQYPLLFQRSDRKHYEHYIEAVQAKSNTPAAVSAQP